MFVDDNILDEIRLFHLSKISVDDIAVYYDYDTTKDFIEDIQLNLMKPFQAFLIHIAPNMKPLNDKEVTKIRKKIEKIRTSPERINRLIKKLVVEYALSLSTFEEIAIIVGKTEEELEKLITKQEILRLNEVALANIRKRQFEKAIAEGDNKTLIHLGQSYIDKQKPKKEDISVNVDNRKIEYIELPMPDNSDDFTKYFPKQLEK